MIKYQTPYSRKKTNEIRKFLQAKHEYNMFEHLMKLLEMSKFTYGINLTKGSGEIKNLKTCEDERLTKLEIKKKKGGVYWPPNGLDAYIEVDVDLAYVDAKTKSHAVSTFNIIFHELFESYMMVNVGLQYKEAHRYAGIQEDIFISQFPGITQWAAYEKITRDDKLLV
jgi:hypothetical protein